MVRSLLAVAVVVLAVPATAAAKESISRAEVCGAVGCVTIDRPDQELGAGGDGIAEPRPSPQPHHRLRLTIDGPHPSTWDVLWIDGASTVAYHGESGMHFEQLTLAAAAAMRDATRGVEPFPTRRGTWAQALDAGDEIAAGSADAGGFDWPLCSPSRPPPRCSCAAAGDTPLPSQAAGRPG